MSRTKLRARRRASGAPSLSALAANELMLVNAQSGKCLTIAGGVSFDNNVDAAQVACDGDPSRTWTITAVAGGLYQITNRQTHKCLTLSDRDNPEHSVRTGVPVQCDCDTDPSRRWTIKPKT